MAAILIGGLGGAVPAEAAPDATRVSIRVSDGVSEVRDRSAADYVATVVNDGDAPITGRLVLQVPEFARYRKAPAATVHRHEASWTVRVPAHSTLTRRATVRIGAIPSGNLRVTSLASLFLGSAAAAPLVRTADSDRIAGVDDPPATPLPQPPTRSPSAAAVPERHGETSTDWAAVALPVVGAVGLAALAGLVWWRRRRGVTDGVG